MSNYAKHLSPVHTPQAQPLPGRESDMAKNPAGGYVFVASDWRRLNRFLMIGTEGGTFYEDERMLTLDNAGGLMACMAADGARVVAEIARISEGGLAPKNSPAIFALVLCAARGDVDTRKAALAALPRVCRIATHLFEFLEAYQTLDGGWGRSVRRAVSAWYTERKPESLALQLVKYRQRNRWTHRDALRVAHVKPTDATTETLLGWAAGKREIEDANVSPLIWAFERAQVTEDADELLRLIVDQRLPRETIPDKWLDRADVWAALLQTMPITALIRTLNRMTVVGLIAPYSDALKQVTAKLTDVNAIHKGRVHPLAILMAAKTYGAGRGLRGSLKWEPVPQIIEALDTAYEASFVNVEPLDKRILIAVDTSGSMSGFGQVAGIIGLTPLAAAAAAALCYLRTQPDAHIIGFDTELRELASMAGYTLNALLERLSTWRGGGTDAAIPAQYALDRKLKIDALLMLTDSMSWAGNQHPAVTMDKLRQWSGIPVRWATVQTTATGTQLQDPKDADSMEMAGFSPDIFQVANGFFRGEL
ncbi:MAG: TROVE domain-containing protein [Chloroflexota bacterium]|nr:TROVE domain-containing protein [Chloroflexota bacterium]